MPHNVFQTQLSWGSAASFLDIEAWPRGREGPGEPRGGGGQQEQQGSAPGPGGGGHTRGTAETRSRDMQ